MGRALLLAAVLVGVIAGSAEGRSNGECSSAVVVSTKTGKVLARPLVSPLGVVTDGRDGWFVAGIRLWHVRRDGRIDARWHSPVRRSLADRLRASAPETLTRHGNRLYVAGRQRVVAVDAWTGRVLWRSPAIAGPTVKGWRATITALAAGSRSLYVGGTFTSLGGVRRVGLAALDAATGRLLSWRAPPVHNLALLALSSSRLYFSGTSTVKAVRAADGRWTSFVPRGRIANSVMLAVWGRYVLIGCASRWSTCDTTSGVFNGRTGEPVRKFAFDEVRGAGAVAFSGSTAYLGTGPEGDFGNENFLIAIDLRTGKFKPWFPRTGYYVTAASMAVSGDRVFVAGAFCPGP
jgi:outer membrane protein assembly factor BamB